MGIQKKVSQVGLGMVGYKNLPGEVVLVSEATLIISFLQQMGDEGEDKAM